jgi:hypothetical protein
MARSINKQQRTNVCLGINIYIYMENQMVDIYRERENRVQDFLL